MMLLSNAAMAQRTVKGKVTDAETGDALIGATVAVVGTTRGASTDVDGNYSVEVPAGSTQIRFAYTGYAEQVVTLSASNVVEVAMKPGSVLDEVVVVGYGSVKKKDATGAVTNVSSKDFNGGIIAAPEQLFQGRAAGVQITSASGEPGAGINIRIRGTSSVRGGNNPLIVVDGVPLSGGDVTPEGSNVSLGAVAPRNPLNFLNPNDIASVDILKDASATAIYGSRGANGVIIITTKSGQEGKGVLEYNVGVGISNITKKYDVLGRQEFLSAYAGFNGQAAADKLDGGADTDWQDEILQTGLSNQHNLTFGAGNNGGNYRFSVGYMDQQGVIKTSALQRINARFNGSKKFIDDRLTISTQVTIARTHDDGVPITRNSGFEGDMMGNALKANPTMAVYNRDGKLNQPNISEPNPVALLELTRDYTNTLRTLGSLSGELQLFKGLSFKTVLGFDRAMSSRKLAWSRDLVVQGVEGAGRLYNSDIEAGNNLWENYFTYNREFGNSNLTALLGYSYQRFDSNNKTFEYTGFASSDLDLMINNSTSASKVALLNNGSTIDELQSYFGRVNFGIASKYIFTATLRADGSTRFGGDNKYGYFPSAAFKWRLIDESFCPDAFSDLGVRLGYGVTGNQEIPHNLYQQRQRYGGRDLDNGGTLTGGGLGTVAFANPSLKWESTKQLNVGIDFGFLDNRFSGSLDFYQKNTDDLLIKVVAAQPAVNPFVWTNLDADVENTGVELALNYVVMDKGDFSWNIMGNVSYNKNIVNNFSGLINTGEINGQGLTGAFAQRIAQGQPLFAYFLREFDGYDDNGITKYAGGDVQKFVGKSPLPKVNGGLTNGFAYKNLTLSVFFTGQFGHYIYSNTANAFFTAGSLANGRNVTKNVVGNGEGRLNAPDVSTRFLESGDFVRLQDLSIGYNIKPKNAVISGIRLYVTGQNLAVFTKYSGQDPEVNTNKSLEDVPSAGIDYTSYPRARTFLLGANVSF